IVGQAGAAAGLVSLIKTALALFHRVLPPLGRLTTPTGAIDWTQTPFHLPRKPEAWTTNRVDGPRLAAVSSMGLDGSCVHAVLEERDADHRDASAAWRARSPGERHAAIFLLR